MKLRFGLGLGTALAVVFATVASTQQAATPVADAARKGDVAAVRNLVKQGADASAPQADGMTALHWAAERADLATADILIRAGASLSAETRLGQYTPLHLAARNGSAEVLTALIKAGSNVKALTASGSTALHLAAGAGSAAAVAALIDGGSDVNARDSVNGQTPLIFAVSGGHVAAMKTLIAKGAAVDLASAPINISQQQAIDRQGATLRRQIIAALTPAGQQPTSEAQQAAVAATREFYATGKLPAPPAAAGAGGGGGRGGGAPDPAAAAGNAGAPAGAAGGRQGGRAGGAAGAPAADGTGIVVQDPLNADGPAVSGTAKGGMTPLHYAARDGHAQAVTALLDAGADINKKSADGNTPLLIALINGQFDVAMQFVEKGANVNLAGDGYGITPLWAAINTRWQPRTRFPQPQEMDYQKATYLDVMKALLESGADPDARVKGHPWYMVYSDCGNANCGLSNVTGSTAYWRAAYGTDVDAMKLLAKYGADPNIPTMAGGGGGRGGGGGGGGAAGRGGAAGGRGGGAPGAGDGAAPAAPPAPRLDPSGLPPVPAGGPGVSALHAAAGAEYGEGFAGNAHRHAPEAWLAAVKYLVEEVGMDVNSRDDGGYTPLHHAAARGDVEVINYLVSKGADVKAVSRRGQTTADMANGPVSRISPYPEALALLVKLGAINNNKCASCNP